MLRRAATGLSIAVCLTSSLAGCGSSSHSAAGTTPVKLTIRSPTGGTRVGAATVEVTGTVSPWQAMVRVAGRQVTVDDSGDFRASVDLALGTNLIDVLAGAPQAQAAMSAIRVVRYALVSVPKVTGEHPNTATKTLRSAGLAVKIDSSANPLNELLPLATSVCSQSPKAGVKVSPGALVTLHTSKLCL